MVNSSEIHERPENYEQMVRKLFEREEQAKREAGIEGPIESELTKAKDEMKKQEARRKDGIEQEPLKDRTIVKDPQEQETLEQAKTLRAAYQAMSQQLSAHIKPDQRISLKGRVTLSNETVERGS